MVTAVWLSSAVEKICALLGRDRGVAVDQAREHAAQRLDAERQRRHVEQQDVLHFALAARRAWMAAPMATTSSGLTPLCGSLPKSCFTTSWTLGMRVMPPTRMTSSIWLAVTPASFSACLHGRDGLLDQIVDQRFELGARDLDGQMLRTRRVGGDEGQVHFRLHRGRKLDLRLFRRFLQALQRELVGRADRCRSLS